MKRYQLVRLRTRNSLGWFDTEDQALEEVAELVHRAGAKPAEGVALYETDEHQDRVVAEGADLVRRTLQRFPVRNTA